MTKEFGARAAVNRMKKGETVWCMSNTKCRMRNKNSEVWFKFAFNDYKWLKLGTVKEFISLHKDIMFNERELI